MSIQDIDNILDPLVPKFPTDTPFMKFWKTMNALLRSRGLEEMKFGEAHGWWQDHNGGWR